MRPVIFAALTVVLTALWLGTGLVGSAALIATLRVEFARLYQSPEESRNVRIFVPALLGPIYLAAIATSIRNMTKAGWQGLNFNTAPKPCVETTEFNRALWCRDEILGTQ